MIQTIANESQASSCMRFVGSLRGKFQELMNAQEFNDESLNSTGHPSWRKAEIVEDQVEQSIDLIRQGKTLGEVARVLGISVYAVQRRINHRGLTVRSIREGAEK